MHSLLPQIRQVPQTEHVTPPPSLQDRVLEYISLLQDNLSTTVKRYT